jgi:hypothetical protein
MSKSWANIMAITCLIIVAVVEAWNQALSGASNIIPHLPNMAIGPIFNFIPIVLLVLAFGSWFLGYLTRSAHSQETLQSQQILATTVEATGQNRNVEGLYRSSTDPFLIEIEEHFRNEAEKYPEDQRVKYLLRVLAITTMTALYEGPWLNIFGSQLGLLECLNKSPLKLNEAKAFFDEAVRTYPEHHRDRSFELWLQFLRNWSLIRECRGFFARSRSNKDGRKRQCAGGSRKETG